MSSNFKFPDEFLCWPYFGSPDGNAQDAYEALARAAASQVPGSDGTKGTAPGRRRGRPGGPLPIGGGD